MMKSVSFSDHPDFVGGIKWSDCELDWINKRDEQWKERIADLERELAECKAKYAADCNEVNAARSYLRREASLLAERFALAAQVVQMREALETCKKKDAHCDVAWGKLRYKTFDTDLVEKALAIDTKPAEAIVAKVKAEAVLSVLAIGGFSIELETAIRRMADELEKSCGRVD